MLMRKNIKLLCNRCKKRHPTHFKKYNYEVINNKLIYICRDCAQLLEYINILYIICRGLD